MTEETPAFLPLDRERDIEIRQRNLPHWFQTGAAIFVTFRAIDSLPEEAVLRMQRELEEWLRIRDLPLELASSAVNAKRADHE